MTRPAVADRATGWFRAWHGAEPEGVWHAPGRVNLIGEHTDYNSGWVLPSALGRGVVVAARQRADGMLDIRSLQAGGRATLSVAGLGPGSVTGWAAYPAGVASPERQSSCRASPAVQSSDADWSRIPLGTPTISFSARRASRASSVRGTRSPDRSARAIATAHSIAADDDRPAPCGRSESITRLAPPTGWPASRRAQATPAGQPCP